MLSEHKKKLLFTAAAAAGMLVFAAAIYRTCFLHARDALLIGGMTAAVTAAFCILLAAVVLSRKGQSRNILILTLVIGCIYTFILAPFSCPDENRHINTVFSFSNTLLGVETDGGTNEFLNLRRTEAEVYSDLFGLTADRDVRLLPDMSTHRGLYANLAKTSSNTYIQIPDLPCLTVPFWSYAPQIAGVTLARVLSLNGAATLIAGRLFSVLFYALMISLAMRITPVGREIFAVASLLPMSMELAASFSYDAFTISVCYVAIAYMLRLITGAEKIGYRQILCLSCFIALVAPVKVIYIFIGLMLLSAPDENFGSRKRKYLSTVVVLLAGLCLIAVYRASHIAFVLRSTGGVGQETFSLSDFFRRPSTVLTVYLVTFVNAFNMPELSTMLGRQLGWLDIYINEGYMYAFFALLCAAAFAEYAGAEKPTKLQRLVMLGAFAFMWLLVMTAMLLDWTPVSAGAIQGIQGRYALPILPLLLLGMNNSRVKVVGKIDRVIPAAEVILHFLVILNILQVTCSR